ncbi:MAG TPA: hypothetical protein DCP47_01790 [Phycisphaerales bacterium]|nr:hypothetical protein [Phycisphaerales bacterium]
MHEKLTGNPILHRQKILVPLLEDWRINNGNSRRAIGQHRGILPNGRSEFKLDSHAKTQADTIIKEILNDEIKGKWNPNTVGKKVKSSNKTSEEK